MIPPPRKVEELTGRKKPCYHRTVEVQWFPPLLGKWISAGCRRRFSISGYQIPLVPGTPVPPGQLHERLVGFLQLAVPGGDASELLQVREEVFHPVPGLVSLPVILVLHPLWPGGGQASWRDFPKAGRSPPVRPCMLPLLRLRAGCPAAGPCMRALLLSENRRAV